MNDLDRRRQQIQWNIQQNPVAITISRTEKVKTEGHFEENKTSVGPFTVRVFKQTTQPSKVQSELAGTKQTENTWGMLADYLADLQAGPLVLDEFDCPLGHFQIAGVTPQLLKDEVAGYQADLTRVS